MNQNQFRRSYRLGQFALGILYPPRCPGCDELLEQQDAAYGLTFFDRELVGCCKKCQKKLFPVGSQYCLHCGKPLDSAESEFCPDCRKKDRRRSFRQGRSIFCYRGAAPRMMYRFKYAGRQEYAKFFARTAAELYWKWFETICPDVIIPVPMYYRKQRRRGYNQAQVFGRELGQLLGIRCVGNAVYRIHNTRPMKELDDVMRVRNLSGAFEVPAGSLPYDRVLLVDDIYTTGATADAVTGILMDAGVKEVYFLSITIGKGC